MTIWLSINPYLKPSLFLCTFPSFLFQVDQSQAFFEHLWCRQPVIRDYLLAVEEVLSWRRPTLPMSSSRMLGKASSHRQRLNVITHSPPSSPHIPKTGLASLRLVHVTYFTETEMLFVRKLHPCNLISLFSFISKFNLAFNQEEMSAWKLYILLRYNDSLWLV